MTRVTLFKVLAGATRLRILMCILASGEQGITVRAIEDDLDSITQSVISIHLSVLREAGLVAYVGEYHDNKNWHHYTCTRPDEIRALLRAADVLRREAVTLEKESVR